MTRLLLVSDQPVLRAGLKDLLGAETDFEIVADAADWPGAMECARQSRVDVVLLDVAPPLWTAVETVTELLALDARGRVLALSAYEEASFARQLMGAGAAGYALKRSAAEELIRAVRVVAAGGTYLDPGLVRTLLPAGAGPASTTAGGLSDREEDVVRLLARGHSTKASSEQLGISPRTLETYKLRAMAKLQLRTRADLVAYAVRWGWLREP